MRYIRFRDEPIARRVAALVGCLLVVAALALPGSAAQATMRLQQAPTPTLTVPPTQTPGGAPIFAITAPLFGANNNIPEGPVNTYVKVAADAGSGWDPNATITLSVTSDSTCGTSAAIPASTSQPITVGGDQSFSAVFAWPLAANQGPTYSVCATESGAGVQVGKSKNTFLMLSSTPPSVNVSPLSVAPGGTVTVTGANFLPVGVIKLWLQHPGKSFNDDPGDEIATNNLQPQGDGTFSVSVKLPTDRTSSNVIVATLGGDPYKENGQAPVTAASQPLTFIAATPTPQVSPTVVPTASAGNGSGSTSTGSGDQSKLLVGLLGLIAVVLLLAGVIVAVLALRGRTTPPDTALTDRRPTGGFGGYTGDGPLDQTVADADWQGRNWDEDDRWQSPPGRPWSGARVSDQRNAPPQRNPIDDDEDDRFRTRMGDPYQSAPPPPQARPNYPPPSRPMGPPQSRPVPPRSNPRPPNPNWNGNDTSGQGPGPDTGPAPWPPRQ